MFFFGAIPVIVLGHVNAFLMVDPNQAERPEFAPYDYLRIRTKVSYQPMLRIHDILVWIRIRGSMPLTNGSGSHFRHWPSRGQQKTDFFNDKVFLLFTFWGTFTSFFKDIKPNRSNTSYITVGIKVFLTIFLMTEGSRSMPLTNGSGSGSMRFKNIMNKRLWN